MATTVTEAVLGKPAVDFQLLATDGTTRTLDDVTGKKGTVIVFICNHCPYVGPGRVLDWGKRES
jgi:peroxiredoxin